MVSPSDPAKGKQESHTGSPERRMRICDLLLLRLAWDLRRPDPEVGSRGAHADDLAVKHTDHLLAAEGREGGEVEGDGGGVEGGAGVDAEVVDHGGRGGLGVAIGLWNWDERRLEVVARGVAVN